MKSFLTEIPNSGRLDQIRSKFSVKEPVLSLVRDMEVCIIIIPFKDLVIVYLDCPKRRFNLSVPGVRSTLRIMKGPPKH